MCQSQLSDWPVSCSDVIKVVSLKDYWIGKLFIFTKGTKCCRLRQAPRHTEEKLGDVVNNVDASHIQVQETWNCWGNLWSSAWCREGVNTTAGGKLFFESKLRTQSRKRYFHLFHSISRIPTFKKLLYRKNGSKFEDSDFPYYLTLNFPIYINDLKGHVKPWWTHRSLSGLGAPAQSQHATSAAAAPAVWNPKALKNQPWQTD